MNPGTELARLYAAWQELTDAETRAIEAEAWDGVASLQREKTALQGRILSAHPACTPCPTEVRGLGARLRQQELHNRQLLERRMAQVRGQLAELEGTSSNLRRVHRSYRISASAASAFTSTA